MFQESSRSSAITIAGPKGFFVIAFLSSKFAGSELGPREGNCPAHLENRSIQEQLTAAGSTETICRGGKLLAIDQTSQVKRNSWACY